MRGWKVLPLGLAMALMTGCSAVSAALPWGQELESAVLMQALGVDVGTQGVDGVAVTASSGGRPAAGESPGQEPVVLSAQADTVTAACAQMQSYGKDFVFFGDVEQLLVGEGQALRGLDPILEHMARDPELRLEAQVWAVKGGGAADALFAAAGTSGASARLEAMQADASLLATAVSRTAREALADLMDNGCTFTPALSLIPARPGDGTEGEVGLAPAGYAVFRDGALAGWAEGDAALGVNLLLDEETAGVVELSTPQQGKAALRLDHSSVAIRPVFVGGVLKRLEVTVKAEAAMTEYRGGAGLDQEVRTWLEQELARVLGRQLRAALDLGQRLDADYLHLGRKAALAAPWEKERLAEQWAAAFPSLELDIQVEANIPRR